MSTGEGGTQHQQISESRALRFSSLFGSSTWPAVDLTLLVAATWRYDPGDNLMLDHIIVVLGFCEPQRARRNVAWRLVLLWGSLSRGKSVSGKRSEQNSIWRQETWGPAPGATPETGALLGAMRPLRAEGSKEKGRGRPTSIEHNTLCARKHWLISLWVCVWYNK